MNTITAKQKIKQAGGKWSVFLKWMLGETVGLNKDGSTDWYEYDVQRFINYGCNLKSKGVKI
jgi:hypothetical protein